MREAELKCPLVPKGGRDLFYVGKEGKEVMTFLCCLCRHYTVRDRKEGIQRVGDRVSQSMRQEEAGSV